MLGVNHFREVGVDIQAAFIKLVEGDQIARGGTLVAEGKGLALQILDAIDAAVGAGDHDREIFRLALIQNRRHRLGTGLIVRQHIAPGAHQRQIGFARCQRFRQAFPGIDGAQLYGATEFFGEVIGQRLIGGIVFFLVRLEQADAELQRTLGLGGRSRSERKGHQQADDWFSKKFHSENSVGFGKKTISRNGLYRCGGASVVFLAACLPSPSTILPTSQDR